MVLIPDIGAAFGQTIFGSGANPHPAPRVPMTFTSFKRLTEVGGFAQGVDIATLDTSFGGAPPSSIGRLSVIEMAVNPNSINFRQSKRITKRDTQEGSVFFHFTNSQGENNDILTMDFSGNTGNLDLRGDIDSSGGVLDTNGGQNTGAAQKLLIWHNLWELTREPMLLSTNVRNEFLITYSSIAIPTQINLIGFFSNVLEWTDSAEKPMSKDYSFSYTVERTEPPLSEILSAIQNASFNPDTTGNQI